MKSVNPPGDIRGKPLRILFINRMASMVRGGGETFDLEMAKNLQALGCEVGFLSGLPLFRGPKIRNPYSGFRFPVSGFFIRTPYLGWFPWDKVKGGWRVRLADFHFFQKKALRWLTIHEGQFDVIQVCELPDLAAWWKEAGHTTPLVMRLTAPNYYDPRGGLKKADALIASGMTVETVRRDVRPDCEDIPNAVDAELFRPQPSGFRAQAGIASGEVLILYVARFQAFKNHEMLVRAFAQFLRLRPKARLVLIGSGPLERRVREQCEELGVAQQVLFMGEVPFLNLPAIYAAADIKVVSSDFESFCFAALEAMATALPIVTTDCGWVPRLIEAPRGGMVVPVKDAPTLAQALEKLASDPALRSQMGAFNRAKVTRDFGWAQSADKLLALYRRILNAPGTARV